MHLCEKAITSIETDVEEPNIIEIEQIYINPLSIVSFLDNQPYFDVTYDNILVLGCFCRPTLASLEEINRLIIERINALNYH
jgi:hypothetical protein